MNGSRIRYTHCKVLADRARWRDWTAAAVAPGRRPVARTLRRSGGSDPSPSTDG